MTTLDESSVAASRPEPRLVDNSYLTQSTQAITILLFVLPLLVVYEIGIGWYEYDPANYTSQKILAFSGMQRFFAMLGATGRFMPAAAVVVIQLTTHLFRRYELHIVPSTFWRMLMESVMYAIPLIGLGYLLQHYLLLQQEPTGLRCLLVMSLGAGLYEELVFRLAMYTVLTVLFVDILKFPRAVVLPWVILSSGVLFSAYHYWGDETFQFESFVFRSLAGIYFGIIFVNRGFGLTVGAHASYDIIVNLLRVA